MKKRLSFLILASILLVIFLTGCCGGGGKTKVVAETTKVTTTGQELQDLQKAKDKGAITEKEYETAKKKILKGK